jgi:hypothetical protein
MKPYIHIESARERRRGAKREARRRVSREIEKRSINMLVKADYVLAPLEAVLMQMELRGTVDVDATGTPVFRDPFGSHWYATAPAIAGIVEFVDQWGIRNQKPVPLAPLRQLHARLDYVMPVDQAMLDEVKALMPALRRIAGLMDPKEAESLLLGSQVKAELDEAAT